MILAAAALIATLSLSARAKETVRIAFVGPLTGGNSAIGLGGRNSADLAVKLRNADAKAKYQSELLVLDDECKPDAGVQMATKAGSDRTIAGGVTNYCSVVAMAALHTYHRFGLPAIVWDAVLPDITYKNDFKEVHRVNGTMINQNETNAKFVAQHGYKNVAIIHDTTDYGKGHDKYFTQFFTQSGGKIAGDFGVTADQQDFTAELTQIKGLSPDALYFGGLTPIGVRIRAQMDKLGLKVQFDGTSGIVNDDFIKALGPIAEGALAFREGAPAEKLAHGKEFLEHYNKQGYAQPPEAYGPFGYGAAGLLMDAIEKAGPDPKKIIEQPSPAQVRDVDSI